MNKRLPDALEDCLWRMEQGESLDSVLAHHPDLAARLHPLLETAVRARPAIREDLPLTVMARQRARGLALAADLRREKNHPLFQRNIWRPALLVLSVIALLVISGNGLLIASAHSIPGDPLYPFKRSVESTQLQLASDPAKRQVLAHTFRERRVDETRLLIIEERVEDVEFSGVVTSQSDDEWLVSGFSVIVTAQTDIEAGIGVGDEVEVVGTTNADGCVDAIRLSLEKDFTTEFENSEVSPMKTASPEEDHVEGSPTQTTILEDTNLEDAPTQSSSPEDGHMEDSSTQTFSPDDGHSQSSATQTPSPEDDPPKDLSTRTVCPEEPLNPEDG
jgi:hypothetical protein